MGSEVFTANRPLRARPRAARDDAAPGGRTRSPLIAKLQGLAAVLAVAAGVYGLSTQIYTWTQWSSGWGPGLLSAWALAGVFAISSIAIGTVVVRKLCPAGRPDGFWALSFTTGAALFALANGLFGWLQLIGPTYFVLLPVGFLAIGWRTFVAELEWKAPARFSMIELVALGFGAVCLVLIGLQTIAPDNVNYDAAWYHLRAAERYALAGGQVRTPEGDLLLTLPQTASWLYTWAFLWPNVVLDQRIRLALLLEFATVAGTLATIPALVRTLCPTLPKEVTRLSWVAFFFFPTVFIYDTGLMGGADHVVALWSVSVIVTWFLARRSTAWGPWALFGIQVAALLAKYSSLYVLVPLAGLVSIDWLVRLRKSPAKSWALRWGPFVTAGVILALTAPYWLRNWIWYRNPVYPILAGVFPNTPWNQDAAAWLLFVKESTFWTENGIFSHKLKISLAALVKYQTDFNTWSDVTGEQPIAGTIHFLSMLALPFIATRKRLLVLALIVNGGILVWFNTHQHQMRYLTVLMSPMAAGAAAVALSLWLTRGTLGRLAVVIAIAWNLAAFADMPFRKTHRMAGGQSTVGLLDSYITRHTDRTPKFLNWENIGAAMPPNAKPLVHGAWPHLGLGRQSVTDVIGLQFGINYARWGSITEIHRQLRKMGVTHMIWSSNAEQADSVTGEALWSGLASQTVARTNVGGFWIGELPEKPREIGEGILYLGCNNLYKNGLYTIDALKLPLTPWFHPVPVPPMAAPVEGDWHALLPRASYVAIENDCKGFDPPPGFAKIGEQSGWARRLSHWVRSEGQATGW